MWFGDLGRIASLIMAKIPGVRPSKVRELTRADERISFLYVERCVLGRDSNAVTATDEKGVVHIPTAALGVLLVGPGGTMTHPAMVLLADSGVSVVWVGERGVRYYAHGRSLAKSARLLEAQAEAVTRRDSRLAAARMMYAMRFPDEDVSRLTMQQLRGREGARVRAAYRESAGRHGIVWDGRAYRPDDFESSDLVNQALSAAHACLYGICHAVIVALGCSPGLGVIHTGHELSFVYDIADLYKAEVSIPVAFECAAKAEAGAIEVEDLGSATRRAVRDAVADGKILSRCARDVRSLLVPDQSVGPESLEVDEVSLWNEKGQDLPGGSNFSDDWDVKNW